MKVIPLTQRKVAIVDNEDYEWAIQWKWYAIKYKCTYYAARQCTLSYNPRKQRSVFMHREILKRKLGREILTGYIVDHKNGYGLNNTRNNLREVTRRQNAQNLHNIVRASEYPGVDWDKKKKKWRAQYWYNGTNHFIGYANSEETAYVAYCAKLAEIGETPLIII